MLKFQLTQGVGIDAFVVDAEPRLADYIPINQATLDYILF